VADGKFKLKKITRLADITPTTVLPESDLCFQDDEAIYQFKHERTVKERKFKVYPGYHVFAEESGSLVLKETELRQRDLLTSMVNTQAIFNEAQVFFKKLDVYDQLGEPKARKILIYSQPGMGKTASITQYCQMAVKEDPGTIIIVWPTSQIESDWVLDFLERKIEYTKKCTRVILIMEDIGGGERENQGESRGVDSALLDLLDGLRTVFKLPTFMIATTNYPQNLLSALADRPGRFDMMLELDPPSFEERVQLVEFISKRSLSDEEKEALSSKELKDFSVAHLKEIVVRSMIHDKTIPQVIKELVAHKKKFHDAFEKKKKDGVGFNS
jgi:ATP-dependent 26S proteasome regulatory subunit